MERAEVCHDIALAASKLVLGTQDVMSRTFASWLGAQGVPLESAPLDNTNLALIISTVPRLRGVREFIQALEKINVCKPTSEAERTNLLKTFRQHCHAYVLTATRSYLEKILQSYENEVVWANMRIAGLVVARPDKPRWDDLLHDMPRTIIKMASTAKHQVANKPKMPTCFDE